MATNFAANVAVNELAARRGIEHRFFLTVAILFPIITVIGFAPSYYFKTLFATPPLPSGLVHAHGISMSLWIVLYLVQTYLITSKQIKLHMTLGIFGVILAAAMIVIGIATGYASAARGAAFPGYTPIEFFIVPIGDMLDHLVSAAAFAVLGMALFGLAWVIVVRVSPFSIRKEIEEDQNTALGIILGSLIIGISIIIAAAVSG